MWLTKKPVPLPLVLKVLMVPMVDNMTAIENERGCITDCSKNAGSSRLPAVQTPANQDTAPAPPTLVLKLLNMFETTE